MTTSQEEWARRPLPVKDLRVLVPSRKASSLASQGSSEKGTKFSILYASQRRCACPTSIVSFVRKICLWTWPLRLITRWVSANDRVCTFLCTCALMILCNAVQKNLQLNVKTYPVHCRVLDCANLLKRLSEPLPQTNTSQSWKNTEANHSVLFPKSPKMELSC